MSKAVFGAFHMTLVMMFAVTADSQGLRQKTAYVQSAFDCIPTFGNVPPNVLNSFSVNQESKTIFGLDGTVYMFTPGQSYGMKFRPGATLHYQIPLSSGPADAVSELVISGSVYEMKSTITVDSAIASSVQKTNGTFNYSEVTCSGSSVTDVDLKSKSPTIKDWSMRCQARIQGCRVINGIQSD